tara:strand:- start:664 stop:1134 length:471 start_codon:yes stop_codon:yes gene_type:complete
MKQRLSYIIFLALLGFILISLFFSNKVFSKKFDFKSSTWELNDTLNFKFISKSELNSNVVLFGKINQDYSFANIYLFAEVFVDNIKIRTDTLNCILYDNFGKPRYNNIGNIQIFKKDYLNNFNFEEEKHYNFKIVHGMRELNLNGIETIGLNIKRK